MRKFRRIKVSKYKNKHSDNCELIALEDALDEIKTGSVKEQIELLRKLYEAGEEEASNKIKLNLPGIVFSTALNGSRKTSNIVEYNMLLALDIDPTEKINLAETAKKLSCDPLVLAIFKSARNGLRILACVNSNQESHKLAFTQLSKYFLDKYGVEVDKQTCDVNRLNFLSYDPDLYVNWEAEIFKVDTTPIKVVKPEINIAVSGTEEKNLSVVKEILTYLKKENKSITSTHEDWYKVAYAFANTFSYELALDLYIKFCELDGANFESEKSFAEFDYCYNHCDGSIGLGTIIHFAQEQGFTLSIKNFWYKTEAGKLMIDELGFVDFLNENGFYTYIPEDGYTLIRSKDQILESVGIFEIKQFVIDYIKSLPTVLPGKINPRELMSKVISLKHVLFNKSTMEFLPTANLRIHRDTNNKCFIYYQNGTVEVSIDEVKIIPYNELDGSIWKKQILKRTFEFCDNYEESSFSLFIKNVCDNDDDRIQSLKSTIGYIIHRYKDPTQCPAVIFSDQKISENGEANGGTGKSLVGEGISKIRNVTKIDGKNHNSKRFPFQMLTLETDIVQFDDVRTDFDFESLYSSITTGINVERKGETPYVIPFEMAPKFEINTNYTIRGTGGNTEERRKFTIEFSDHYGPDNTPSDEFGNRFFQDWDKTEWMKFDNFIVHCVQLFLKNGLIPYAHRTLNLRNLISRTSEDFVEYMKAVIPDVDYDLQEFRGEFVLTHPAYKNLSHRRFCKWIKLFIDTHGLKTYSMVNDLGYFQKKNSLQFMKIVEGLPLSDENTK